MLVDRVSCRLDSSISRRENEYRHPPLYIVSFSFRSFSIEIESNREQSRELVKNTHVQIELIEESP